MIAKRSYPRLSNLRRDRPVIMCRICHKKERQPGRSYCNLCNSRVARARRDLVTSGKWKASR